MKDNMSLSGLGMLIPKIGFRKTPFFGENHA